MARLHEYQGKAIFAQYGLPIPRGRIATSAEEARDIASEINAPVVVKAQIWVTGRAGKGLVQFAETPDQAYKAAASLLGKQVDNFTIERVMVEQQVAFDREFYLGLIIDDRERAPVVIFSSVGGTGIEDIAREHPDQVARHTVDIRYGLRDFEARDLCRRVGINGKLMMQLSKTMLNFYAAARGMEARSAEINPLVLTEAGELIAVDARFTVDDYAVFRHKELDVEIAREFDRPPTPLEKIAWDIEKNDYRGTFYFIQMETDFQKGDGVVGFHGAGGGGSMMNMDALLRHGFKIANFVDTSGNPPASKVYRAARIILSQQGIDGYYAGGSGVASQEQFHSARGLVKAFMDAQLNVPGVIRLGGNAEEYAIEILERANGSFPAPVKGYGRDDAPDFCAQQLENMIAEYKPVADPAPRDVPQAEEPYSFETVTGGTVTFDHARCRDCESKICVETCVPQILSLEGDVPVLNIGQDAAKRGGCTECLACEVECHFLGNKGGFIQLPIEGLDR